MGDRGSATTIGTTMGVVPPSGSIGSCLECGGTGKRGIFGPAGLGMLAYPCPKCNGSAGLNNGKPQIDVVGKPVADPGNVTFVDGVPRHVVDYKNANAGMFSDRIKSSERQERKVELVRIGGDYASQFPIFPASRKYNDVCWTMTFIVVALAVMGMCIYYMSSSVWDEAKRDADIDADLETYPSVGEIIGFGAVACFVAAIVASAYMFLARTHPSCVVYTSLIFAPAIIMVIGILLIVFGSVLVGVCLIVLGFFSLFLTFCCWGHLIPFTIEVVRIVSGVAIDNPFMLFISLVGTILAISWSFLVVIPVAGFYLDHLHGENTAKEIMYVLYFCFVLLFVWGSFVSYNVCHVTYCGVFGRWYYNRDDGYRLRMSLSVALTSAFGSICLGSFLISIVRALEAVTRLAKNDSAEGGNIVCCVILCAVECIISCIGDLLEYFSEWAYVQVAVRGCNFCTAVKITFSRCSCASLHLVVSDLLINSVVNMGALLCGACGALAGGLIGFAMGGGMKATVGSLLGLWCGILAGGAAVGMITSGTKTILSLWAESSEGMRANFEELNRLNKQFEEIIETKMGGRQPGF